MDIEGQKVDCESDSDEEIRECDKMDILKMNIVLCVLVGALTFGFWGLVKISVYDENQFLF